MTSGRLYHERKRQGICTRCGLRPPRPLGTQCPACGLAEAARKAAWVAANPLRVRATGQRYRDRHRLAPGPNLVACCGRWWKITQIPLRVSCSGSVYFAQETLTYG